MCVRGRGGGRLAVILNRDKLELLEGLLLAGWPLKEQLFPALIQPVDGAAAPTIDYLDRSIWAVGVVWGMCAASGASARMSVWVARFGKNLLDLAT